MAVDTEQIILDTARKHFVQNGYAGTRMQEIATEAGINKAMLHYYFRSKEKLYHTIIVNILDYMVPRIAQALSSEGDFWTKVEKVVNNYVELLLEYPDIPFFLVSEISQRRETLVEELKKRSHYFPMAQQFMTQMMKDMEAGKIKQMNPVHLFLNILSMTVFPFVVKPVLCTIFNFTDETFEHIMVERKVLIIKFLRSALEPD